MCCLFTIADRWPHPSAVTIWTVLRRDCEDACLFRPIPARIRIRGKEEGRDGSCCLRRIFWTKTDQAYRQKTNEKRAEIQLEDNILVCLCISTLSLKHIWSLSPPLSFNPPLIEWKVFAVILNQLKRHNAASAKKHVGTTVFVFVLRKKEWWSIELVNGMVKWNWFWIQTQIPTLLWLFSNWGAFPKSIVSQLWSQVPPLPAQFNDSVVPETIVQTNVRNQRHKFTWFERLK